MGYKIVAIFEFPSAESKAEAEEVFWKTVTAGDTKELKECEVGFCVKPLPGKTGWKETVIGQLNPFAGNGKR